MDYNGFKKTKEDAKSTTLQHPRGHTITIAHSGLSPEHKAGLKKLPLYAKDGVEVPDDSEALGRAKDLLATNQSSSSAFDPDTNYHADTAGYTPKAAPEQSDSPMSAADTAQMMADRDFLAQVQSPPSPPSTPLDTDSPASASPAEPPVTAGTASPVTPPPADATPASVAAQATSRANQEQMAGNMSPDQVFKARMQTYAQQDQAWARDLVNGKITPKTYSDLFQDKSTLGKIGMIFGTLLSGAGSGLAHQPNAAMQMINNELERDYNAQVKSKENAYNFVRMNQQHQVELAQIDRLQHENKLTDSQAQSMKIDANIKAQTNARMQMNRAALHKLTTQAATMPDGPQKQLAQQKLMAASTMVDAQNYQLADAAAAKASMFQGLMSTPSSEQAFQGQNQAMRMLGMPDMAKQREEHHYPGLAGQSSIPLSNEDRDALTTGIQFQQKLERFMNWTATHSGDLSPSEINEGTAMSGEVQGAYRQATHGGVYKEGEQNFISKLIDSTPTKFFNSIRVMPQLKALSDENKQRIDSKAKSLGFQGYGPATQQAQGMPSTSKSGRPIVWRDGKAFYQ
jgi:hypothetical protein